MTRRDDVASVAEGMWRLSRLLERLRTAKDREHPTEFARNMLLCTLERGGPMRAGALAEAVLSDASTVSRQVAGLVADGLVERRPDPEDRRAAVLAVTDEGTSRVRGVYDRRDTFFDERLADWSAADIHRLAALMARLVDDLEPAVDAAAPPASATA